MNTIVSLLLTVCDKDYDAMLVLADALEEVGDNRSGRVRATHALIRHLDSKTPWKFTDSFWRMRIEFAHMLPELCVVPNWRIPKEEMYSDLVNSWTDNFDQRQRHRGCQRRFKETLKTLRLPFEYQPKDGSLVIGFPGGGQIGRLKAARRRWNVATVGSMELFEAAIRRST